MNRISQRKAKRLQKRVAELERQEDERRNAWAREWPGGVHISTIVLTSEHRGIISTETARRLGHAVVATVNNHRLELRALPLSK